MAVISMPTNFLFTKVPMFKLQRSTNTLRSKFTGQGQTVVFPFAIWMLQGNLSEYDGLNAGRIRSFFVQLDGQKNTFRLPVPGFKGPMSGYTGNVSLRTNAIARANVLNVNNGIPNARILEEGDYFTIQDELKIVTSPVVLNANGEGVVSFKPSMRKPCVAGTWIKIQVPTCLMRAADDDVANWAVAAPIRQQANFSAIEAVDI